MTDPYSDCEMAIAKRIASLTDIFKAGSVSQGNYTVIEKGYESACVITPGSFQSEKESDGSLWKIWQISVDVFQRNSSDAWAKFRQMRSAVITEIESHPSLMLDGGVQVAGVMGVSVVSGDLPSYVEKEGTNTSTHIVQTLAVQVRQLVYLDGGEFD